MERAQSSLAVSTGPLPPAKTLEERTLREMALRGSDQWDERTALEKLFDFIAAARLSFYRPLADANERRDLICLCCGQHYRPDDPHDAVNVFLCLNCIYVREGK